MAPLCGDSANFQMSRGKPVDEINFLVDSLDVESTQMRHFPICSQWQQRVGYLKVFLSLHGTGRLSSLRRRSRSPPREREGADALASGEGLWTEWTEGTTESTEGRGEVSAIIYV